ncbi:tripartite tricarboxylate transporter substrate binding protein [Ottowia testudinis]|uniref:Tripartite tricarboxylate transporter substrate binding protein n=1 Tax=Ottowia testudinis TaxID=2816950 RepID=A0A975H2C1_9BURK|nr:tripartite tricarboxylate transporter substrate binding protein [Ottowia testudinis]QTD44644.1 tripartite tricarboxylate transporter substrate binding protein [Ottowia testudinis]
MTPIECFSLSRRHVLSACAVLALAPLAAPAAATATWPERPVRWVVPFPPGGAMDVIARTLGDEMAQSLGRPFVIENRAGAGGNIGADQVAKAKPDGYTMMITSIGMATNPFLYQRLSYDPVKDFEPVSLLAVVPNVLVTNQTQPSVKTVQDVLAAARAQPGQLTYASAGVGTSIHLAGELFAHMGQVRMQHVPYRGSGPAVADLLGGQVNYMFDSITSAKPHIDAGKLRVLGITTAKRSAAMPGVPTIAEAALPGYDLSPWFAVFMPAGTPQSIVARLNKALVDALAKPSVRAKLASVGAEPIGSSPAELASHLAAETKRWGQIIRERSISAE